MTAIRRTALAVAGALALGGCMAETVKTPDQPTFYLSMANGGAVLDQNAAASMISGYRKNNGLGAVTVDPALTKLAEQQARAMAARNKLDHDVAGALGTRLNAGGYAATSAVENISAGYHTLAEAFSGWRDSPPHRANMLKSGVSRLGIAAIYAPETKYKVFWAMILAAPDTRAELAVE